MGGPDVTGLMPARVVGKLSRHSAFSEHLPKVHQQSSQHLANVPQCVSASPPQARTLRNCSLIDISSCALSVQSHVKLGRSPRRDFSTLSVELATGLPYSFTHF